MEDNKKPDWLKQFEEKSKEFKDTKWANLTDSELARIAPLIKTSRDSEIQRERAIKGHSDPVSKSKILEALEKGRENGASSIGGKGRWKQMKETGELDKLHKMRTEASLERITCPKCGLDANTGNYARFHGKNCKHNELMKFFNELPETFSRKQACEICEANNYPKNFPRKIINDRYLDLIECIHKGTNGSMIDIPIFKKKGDQ